MDSGFEIKWLTKAFEKLSKRLRFLETLPRPSSTVVDTFLELGDTPDVYGGYKGFAVVVNPLEDGLQFQPFGGVACVAFTCGPIGWRAVGPAAAGVLEQRTLVHEVAFQLDTVGNARGAYAIDLQQVRWGFDPLPDVAAGDYSAILGGKENRIHPNSQQCFLIGSYNWTETLGGWEPFACHVLGESSTLYGDCYGLSILGEGHNVENADYGTYTGYNQQIESAFGCYSLIEGNDIVANVNEEPTYSGSIGILNLIEGDVFDSYQFGESNAMIGLGTGGGYARVWACFQVGYNNKIDQQGNNVWQFGRSLGSYLPAGLVGSFFDGRFIINGDNPREAPSGTEFSGFNQNSWFNQDTAINTWTVAWISSRFQFPIIEDSIWFFHAEIAGTELGCANSYAWKIEGVIENDGGNTTILTSTVTNVYRDIATKEWQVIADNVNDRLVFQFRDTAGPDATRCNIQFSMHTVEVGYD